MTFFVEQVKALCGGSFPDDTDFDWAAVERFELENNVLQPYAGKQILPGPGIIVAIKLDDAPF